MTNILLTSVGRRSYLIEYFKESLKNEGKVFASNSELTIALKDADDYFLSPLIYDEGYVNSIIDFCLKHKIKYVLSLFDIDLLVLAKDQYKFEKQGITLILAPYESIHICNDKWETYKFFTKNEIITPKTYLNIQDAISALNSGEINFPIVIKPRWGMASMGIYFASNIKELEVLYKKSETDVFNSYLKFESSKTSNKAVIIQEKIDGKEYGVDIVNDLNNQFLSCFVKQKVTMRAGETDLGLTVSNHKFVDLSSKISNLILHKGVLSLDCFVDKDGNVVANEMNCRISGHYPISHLAGFNFPSLLLKMIKDEPILDKDLEFIEGVRVTKKLVPVALDKCE